MTLVTPRGHYQDERSSLLQVQPWTLEAKWSRLLGILQFPECTDSKPDLAPVMFYCFFWITAEELLLRMQSTCLARLAPKTVVFVVPANKQKLTQNWWVRGDESHSLPCGLGLDTDESLVVRTVRTCQ